MQAKSSKTEVASRLPSLLENMMDGCQIVDFKYRYLYLNKAAVIHARKPLKALLGNTMMEMYPGIEKTDIFKCVARCMQERKFQSIDSAFTFPDGHTGFFKLRMQPIEEGTLILTEDITEHNKRSELLAVQTKALNSTVNALVITDVKGRIEWVNPAFTKLTGYSHNEAIGQSPSLLKSGKHSKSFYGHLWKTIMSGKPWHGEMVNRKKNGKLYEEEQTITPVVGDDGEITHFIAIKQDISARKKYAQTFAERTRELEIEKIKNEAMLASIGDGVFAVDLHRKFILINKKAEELFGEPVHSLLGKKTPADIRLEDGQGRLIPPNQRPTYLAIKKEEVVTGNDYTIVRRDKTRIPISLTVTPIRLNGKIIGAIDIFRDISHEKEIDRAKSEFVSLASHQLRTPLGISKWYIESIMKLDYCRQAPPTIKEYINKVYANNERILDLVRNLLSISRIEQGQIHDTLTPIKVGELIRGVVERLSVLAEQHKLKISLEMNDALTVWADSLKFEEAMENLVINSIRYNVPGGEIGISVKADRKDAVIIVSDNGIGISQSDQRRLFTKFFRADHAVLTNPEGSGLGLFVVKSYIETWGGTISVDSKEGRGSTFKITLPLKIKSKRKEAINNEKNTNHRR